MTILKEEIEKLPEGYNIEIPRVSNIISVIFPFEGTENEKRYLEWLAKNNIKEEDYLTSAQDLGTFIHLQLENYAKGLDIDIDNPLYKKTKAEIKHGNNFLNKISEIETEIYIREVNNRFQGSCDLLYKDNNGNKVLADYKTWGIAKGIYGLDNKFIVSTDKKKKVQLQLSFYAYGLRKSGVKVDRIELLFLHKEGLKAVDLEILSDEVIENYLTIFEVKQQNEDIEILIPNLDNMFEIEILEPTKTYGNVKVRFDLNKSDNGKTPQENIEQALQTVRYLKQELQD